LLLGCTGTLAGLCAFQLPFREYPGREYENFPLPTWTEGRTSWTTDYPHADRHFSSALRRLSRVHVRSVEQSVNLDDGDEVYNWPWLCAVEVGHCNLTDAHALKLREFLLRGGFFMCDDFHGTEEWEVFTASMKRVFPDRPIVEIQRRTRSSTPFTFSTTATRFRRAVSSQRRHQ
jgi:hypothetical protein